MTAHNEVGREYAVDCCEEHDDPHAHGCQRERVDGVTHPGACINDRAAAEKRAAADEARWAAMDSPPQMAWFQVPIYDDYPRHYPRPNVLEVSVAAQELRRLDEAGELPLEIAAHVRIVLGVVGRLPGDGMAEAFPPPPQPPRLAVVSECGGGW